MSYEFQAPIKDPQSRLRHSMDWSAWLADGETITAQTVVSSDPALVIDQVAQADGLVSWRVAGGAAGSNAVATCSVTTSAGRIDERSVEYRIRER